MCGIGGRCKNGTAANPKVPPEPKLLFSLLRPMEWFASHGGSTFHGIHKFSQTFVVPSKSLKSI